MVLAHLAAGVGDQLVTVVQGYAKARVGEDFRHRALHFGQFFFGHFYLFKTDVPQSAAERSKRPPRRPYRQESARGALLTQESGRGPTAFVGRQSAVQSRPIVSWRTLLGADGTGRYGLVIGFQARASGYIFGLIVSSLNEGTPP